MNTLVGYTYPRWLQNRLCWWLWRHLCCRCGWHLLDEVASDRHYLYCDACDIEIELSNAGSERPCGRKEDACSHG